VTDFLFYRRFGWIVVMKAKLSFWRFCILFTSVYRLLFLLWVKRVLLSKRRVGSLSALLL